MVFLGGQLVGAGQKPRPNQPPLEEQLRLHLRAGSIDPQVLTAPVNRIAQERPALYLVQFTGPIQDAWLAAVQACGLAVVSYVPDYAYLVWGKGDDVDCLGQRTPLNWQGLYEATYVLHPSLMSSVEGDKQDAPAPVNVIIQLYETTETSAALKAIFEKAQAVLRQPQSLLGYRVLAVRLPHDSLMQVAALPGVVNIEPLPRYSRNDEVQGQIMAGNLTVDGAQPSGPGYLAWLIAQGFSTNPEDYPIVDVTDDGIDNGSVVPNHADFYQLGDKANRSRLIYNTNWTTDPLADGLGGHGNLNASIVAGYNNLPGPPYADEGGYHYGLGINPFGRVAGSKVFSLVYGWDLPNDDFRALIENTYLQGGRISTNSWGAFTMGTYTLADQIYDSLVRDAVLTQSGNQEITIIFSAGNDGPYPSTIGSPGNAKNVLTVGAAENYRPTWTDGCSISPQGADNARDIIDFSSRGPTSDGRNKPDLVAPGTHIQGAASQVQGYTGAYICDAFHPAGQTLYAASSGTSHSTPAVAGAASLFFAYYQEHFSDSAPSPAMVKAYLSNAARYLDGIGANDTLPSASQGYGEVFLSRAFDHVNRVILDQEVEFTQSGQVFSLNARILHSSQPVRVTLAWTDAPGAPYAAAYVNNLDLEVELNGQVYLGNVFNGAFSITGGQADTVNNLESVFLPAGNSGSFQVRVHARNIGGDGVPGDGDLTDQDFALVVYNGAKVMGYLRGTVTDSTTGDGLAEARLQASSTSWDYNTTTDGAGNYSLPLEAGEYVVSAWKYGYSQEVASGVEILNDQVTVQDFTLSPADSYELGGCVTDQATGQGLGASISVIGPLGNWMTQTLTTRSQPCYHLNLAAASYRVRVESLLHYPAETQLDLHSNMVLDFALQATTLEGLLRGRVSDYNTSEPLSGINILVASASSTFPDLYPYPVTTDSQGIYAVLLPPDTYTVSIVQPFYTPVQVEGVVVPQSNIEERNFDLQSARIEVASTEPLRFDLQPGEQANTAFSFQNTGSATLDYFIYESSGNAPVQGPDPAGYLLLDSRSSYAVRYDWVDASDGTRLDLLDDGEFNINLPFLFSFYGQQSDLLRISNNGAAFFGVSDGDILYVNQPLSYAPNHLIAPFWDDLDSDDGWVAYKTVGVAPHRRFVVEWFDRPHYSGGASGVTFEMILYEGSNNLKFQYQDVIFDSSLLDRGLSATIGIRDQGINYLQFSHASPSLDDRMALCFQAPGALPCDVEDVPWLAVTPEHGALDPLGEQVVTVQVDAGQTTLGIHLAIVRLWGNDPLSQPYIEIPVRLIVHGHEWYFPFANNLQQLITSLAR